MPVGACARAPPHFRCSLAGSLGSLSLPFFHPRQPPLGPQRRRVASSLARHTSFLMQRRDDPAARLTRSSGRSCSKDPSGAHPSVRLTPSRPSPLPHRSRGGGGGPRGGARASPATQPPPLLPPSNPGPDATVVGSAPTPLLPPSATAAAKMEPENKYLPELMAEKDSLDPSFTHAMQLLSVGKRVLAYFGVSRYRRWVAAALFLLPPPRSPGIESAHLDLALEILHPQSHPGSGYKGRFRNHGRGPKRTRDLRARRG